MKQSNSRSRHIVNHNLRNQVISGQAARRLKDDMVESRLENDPWYQYNMGGLMRNFQLGRVAKHVFKNVAERLYRIGHHRAQSVVEGVEA